MTSFSHSRLVVLSNYFLSSDLVINLALPPTAWQDNFDFPGLATWTTEARQHIQLFHSLVRKSWYFRDELFGLFNYVNDAHKVAFRGMQALNTSGLLELMESLGAMGECQVGIFTF